MLSLLSRRTTNAVKSTVSSSLKKTTAFSRAFATEDDKRNSTHTTIGASHDENIIWSDALFSTEERKEMLGAKHDGATLWLSGLSGSGKSTIAANLEKQLLAKGVHCYRLDGDNVRFGLNKDLGFTAEDREENIRRIGETACLFADSGVVAITAFISPYKKDREAARAVHERNGHTFIEVFTEVPLEVAEQRDPKGLYKKARAGEIKNFTGIDDPYEIPANPEITINTADLSIQQSVDALIDELAKRGIVRM